MTKLGLMARLAVVLMLGGAIAAPPAVAQDAPDNEAPLDVEAFGTLSDTVSHTAEGAELAQSTVVREELTSQSGPQSVEAEIAAESADSPQAVAEMPTYREMAQSATTVEEWLAQIEASLTQITGVQIEETEAGLQVVFETAEGALATPTTQTVGNALIADIPNAVLVLPEGESFEQFAPAEGIALVQVTNEAGDQVRVAITGTDAPPMAEVTATGLAVTLGQAVAGAEDDAIQVVVTGEEDEGYNPSSASTATRTDTPLRDVPFSVQVVPQQVIEDRNVRTITEAVETVSGVVEDFRYFNGPSGNRRIRGFTASRTLRNGFLENNFPNSTTPLATVERVEVLKGPASTVIGAIEPGGIVNYVTRQPLSEPHYRIAFEAGNFGLLNPSIDLSGPITTDGNVLYRFIADYEDRDSYQDFANSETIVVAPSISVELGNRTDLNLYYEYSRYSGDPFQSGVPLLSDGSLPSRNLYPSYPLQEAVLSDHKAGYTLTHEFNESWQIRNNFAFTETRNRRRELFPVALVDDRFLSLATFSGDITDYNYFAGVSLLGEFETGTISHRLLTGFDFNYYTSNYVQAGNFDPTVIPPLDITNPDYDALTQRPEVFPGGTFVNDVEYYGVYLQNQIEFSENWKLLIGGRYDWISEENGFIPPGSLEDVPSQSDGAFSPRVGLVYQPSGNVSLYASYSRSFNSAFGRNPDNEPFEPTRGTQYEVGVKADFLDGRLSATLAAYNLTKTNILTPDPDPVLAQQGFRVQVGEQRSRGVELDVTGEILPGWNIIASYALTDTEVTEDNSIPSNEGNSFINVPLHQASLWTTYEIQQGDLQGLGFGLGLFYVGERQGDLANTLEVDDYLRTDAALYYRRDQFNAAINFRNVFDLDYISSVNFAPLFIERGEPFTIVGSISWEF